MGLEGRLITGYYIPKSMQKPLLHLVIRTDVDKKYATEVESPIYPYCFCKKADLNGVMDVVKQLNEEASYLNEDENNYRHLYNKKLELAELGVYNPKNVGRIRKACGSMGIELFEADISFMRRWMIDKGIFRRVGIKKGEIYSLPLDYKVPNERYLFWDVEHSRKHDKITMISCGETVDDIVSFEGDSLVGDFLNYAHDYDIWVAWYVEFDENTLIKEAKKLGLKFSFREHVFMDLKGLHELASHRQQKLESMALDFVANYELGEGKIDLSGYSFDDLHLTNPSLLKKYNRKDVELIIRLNHIIQKEPSQLLETHTTIADIVGLESMDKTLYPSAVTDTFMMREYVKMNPRIVLPCRKDETAAGETYKGAKVYIPALGIFEDVEIYDFTGLYTSIIRSANISPELYEDWMDKEKDVTKILKTLASKPFGVFPSQLTTVTIERDKAKKNKNNTLSGALKVVGNASYGSVGQQKSRFYSKVFADLIPRIGRYLFVSTESKTREMNIVLRAGDTDSVFVSGKRIT